MVPRAGLDGYEKSHPYRGGQSPAFTARSKSLYRLRYRAPRFTKSTGWVGLLKEREFMLTKSREDLQVLFKHCAEICSAILSIANVPVRPQANIEKEINC